MKRLDVCIRFKYDDKSFPTTRDECIIDELVCSFLKQYEKIFSLMGLKLSCSFVRETDSENPFMLMTAHDDYEEGDEFW